MPIIQRPTFSPMLLLFSSALKTMHPLTACTRGGPLSPSCLLYSTVVKEQKKERAVVLIYGGVPRFSGSSPQTPCHIRVWESLLSGLHQVVPARNAVTLALDIVRPSPGSLFWGRPSSSLCRDMVPVKAKQKTETLWPWFVPLWSMCHKSQ